MGSQWPQDFYIRAHRFAAAAHWNSNTRQLVPGTDIPYLMHFSLVAMVVIAALEKESALDGNLAVQCALLHDTMEDTDATYAGLNRTFGLAVADGVLWKKSNSNQMIDNCIHGGLCAVDYPEFVEDINNMTFCGVWGDKEPF